MLFRFLLTALLVLAVVHTAAAGPYDRDGKLSSRKYFEGRYYLLDTPSRPHKKRLMPLVIVLHGATGNSSSAKDAMGRKLRPVMEQYGFKVAYLNGSSGKLIDDYRTWNAGLCCGAAGRRQNNDVGYIRQFIRHAVKDLKVDPKRIFLLGYSNGAMMAYRYVCQYPNTVAAITVISGTIVSDKCNPEGLKAVLHIHGGEDRVVPVEGGISKVGVFRTGYYTPIADVASLMQEAGVRFQFRFLENIGHRFAQTDRAINVPATAWSFFRSVR